MARGSQRKDFILGLRNCFMLFHTLRAIEDSDSDSLSDDASDMDGHETDEGFSTGDDIIENSMGESEDSWSSSSESESDSEAVYELLLCLEEVVQNSRYVVERINTTRSQEYKFRYFLDQTDEDFRIMTRMSKASFRFVVITIEEDPIFQNHSEHKQAPVHWQVACALDRLGNDGQGVSAGRSKVIFGLGKGTVFAYYNRVIEALCNVREQFIVWPDRYDRLRVSRRNARLGFKGAVGFVDGTTFPLHQKPSFHGTDYMDRKKRYSVAAQVVCDDRHRITQLLTGMTGSTHDSRMFSLSGLVQSPNEHFSPGQYLIGDSAYAATQHLVPAYKGRMCDTTDPEEGRLIEVFNTRLAKARVVNEHTIGILKSRWTSLRELRIQLRDQTDVYRVMKHTLACAILHNIVVFRDPWEDAFVECDEPEREEDLHAGGPRYDRRTPGQQKRYEGNMREEDVTDVADLKKSCQEHRQDLSLARQRISELERIAIAKRFMLKRNTRAWEEDVLSLKKKCEDLEAARDVMAKSRLQVKVALEEKEADLREALKVISKLDRKVGCNQQTVIHLRHVIQQEKEKYSALHCSHEDLEQCLLRDNIASAGLFKVECGTRGKAGLE